MLKNMYHICEIHCLTKSLGLGPGQHQEFLILRYLKWISFNFAQKTLQLPHWTRGEIPITDLKHPWSFKSLYHIYLSHYLSLGLDPVLQPSSYTSQYFKNTSPTTYVYPKLYSYYTKQGLKNIPFNTTESHHTTSINTVWKQWNCSNELQPHSRMTPLFSLRAIAGMTALTMLSLNRQYSELHI